MPLQYGGVFAGPIQSNGKSATDTGLLSST